MADAKQDPMVELTLAPARDGGYVVHTAYEPPRFNGLIFAGSLRECLEYMAKHFGAEAKTPGDEGKSIVVHLRGSNDDNLDH